MPDDATDPDRPGETPQEADTPPAPAVPASSPDEHWDEHWAADFDDPADVTPPSSPASAPQPTDLSGVFAGTDPGPPVTADHRPDTSTIENDPPPAPPASPEPPSPPQAPPAVPTEELPEDPSEDLPAVLPEEPSEDLPEEPALPDSPPADPFAVGAEVAAPATVTRAKKSRSFWVELPILILIALGVAVLVKIFLVQAFYIPSPSMRETLIEGDRVMVNKLAYRFGDPQPGHVVVFDSPMAPSTDGENFFEAVLRNVGEALGVVTPESALIKRIVAVGGQTVEIRDGTLYVDDAAVDEPYLRTDAGNDFGPETVPADHVFVLGDNRHQSEDGRRFGAVPESTIIGRAFVRVWPPSRWGGL